VSPISATVFLSAVIVTAFTQIHIPRVNIGIAVARADLPTFKVENPSSRNLIGAHEIRWGQVFKQGAVPRGSDLGAIINGSPTAAQLDCKTTHPDDGSCKHGIISLYAPSVPANATYHGKLAIGTGGRTPVNLAALPASGYTLSLSLAIVDGAAYKVDVMTELSSALREETCSYWQRGPIVSECRINKDLEGSLHLHLDIGYWADGSVRADIQVLNDYAFEPIGTRYLYNYTITQNGSTAIKLSNVMHELYTTRHDVIWSNGAPNQVIHGDNLYLTAAGALPPYDFNYDQDTAPGNSMTTAVMYSQMAGPNWNIPFPYDAVDPQFHAGGGSAPDLGLHTAAQTLWVMNWKKVNQTYAMDQTRVSGSIPWHAFDKAQGHYANTVDHHNAWFDGRDYSFPHRGCHWQSDTLTTNASTPAGSNILHFASVPSSIYVGEEQIEDKNDGSAIPPDAVITAITSTTVTLSKTVAHAVNRGDPIYFSCWWRPEPSHAPSLTALPYLLTGDRYLLDETQAQAAWAINVTYPPNRQYAGHDDQVLNLAEQVRSQAWSFRSLVEAAYLSPDDSFEKGFFDMAMAHNIDYANTQTATLSRLQGDVHGWIFHANGIDPPYSPPLPAYMTTPPWMHDYIVSALVDAINKDIQRAAVKAFLKWMANWKVGMWMPHTGWDWRNGQMYYMETSDGSGNYLRTWADISKNAIGHTPCVPGVNDCNFASGGWTKGNYAWLGANSCALISYVFGSTAPGPDAHTCHDQIVANIQNYTITAEPQFQYVPK
jgi:hypothetical protein